MTIFLIIIFLSLLILVHELGHFLAAKWAGMRVDEFGIGFPPRLITKKWGETTYSLNALPFGGYVSIYGEDPEEVEGERERSFAYQPAWKKTVVILAGVFMNVVFAWLALSIVFMTGAPQHLGIAAVVPDSPAEKAGLQTNDVILEAGADGTTLTDPIKAERFVEFSKNFEGQEIALKIQRGDEVLDKTLAGRVNPPEGEGSLGISLVDMGVEKRGFAASIVEGAKTSVQSLKAITVAFVDLFQQLFTTPDEVEGLTGPVGIFVIAQGAGSLGIAYLLQLMAIISLNLAILNLIPFPALDGGRQVVIIAEKIKGSPVSAKVQRGANALGFVLLILLMVWVTVQDVGRFIL